MVWALGGTKPSDCHGIAIFRMKEFGTDIGQIVWYWVGTG